jgi:RNA polymerase sigma-70 factor (ECF subfamily)
LTKHINAFGHLAAAIQQESYLQVIDWQKIVKSHGPAVWRTAYRLLGNETDAADCFQETFIGALEVSRRQRVRKFAALLIKLATARAIDRLRQRYTDSMHNTTTLCTVPTGEPGPAQQAAALELAEQLRKALAQISPQEAQVFCLRHLNGMSYRQIAKELGIKTNTAGVMLHRARARLREILQAMVNKED